MKKIDDFKKYYTKVNGTLVLKGYAKSKVLFFALLQTLLQGIDKKSLEITRLSVENRIYKRLKKKNTQFIQKQHYTQDLEHIHSKIIWTAWMQGEENAPDLVKKCLKSMRDNIKDREIIVITEQNYSDYVSFPDYIIDKYKQGKITKTHFSDLLRIELLCKYGGTWLDSTVFVTELLKHHTFYLDSNLFLFQTLKPGVDGHCSSISSWMITSCSNNNILLLTKNLLYNYWKSNDFLIDYFLLHYFFQMSLETYAEEWKNVVPISNEIPHILLLRLNEEYNEEIWNNTKYITPFHKLSYKIDESIFNDNTNYFSKILKDYKW